MNHQKGIVKQFLVFVNQSILLPIPIPYSYPYTKLLRHLIIIKTVLSKAMRALIFFMEGDSLLIMASVLLLISSCTRLL